MYQWRQYPALDSLSGLLNKYAMDRASHTDGLPERLHDGLERIALVSRAEMWASAGRAGLNPTQAQVLALLAGRPEGLRARDIAAHLGVSAASISDTLAALLRKGLVGREADPGDGRAMTVRLSEAGLALARDLTRAASPVVEALAALPAPMQEQMLLAQIALIRQLLDRGVITPQRMCATCRHFRPNAHPGRARAHHCAFVDAAIGNRDLRLDCGEHEAADAAFQAATWTALARTMAEAR